MNAGKLCSLFALVACGTAPARAAAWDLVKVHGREYVSFANVAEFYRFPEYNRARRTIALQSDRCGLRAQAGASEVYINGARFFTHFPLIEQGNAQLISAFDVAKLLEPVLRPSRIRHVKKVETVVLDPGHGGADQGATSKWGSEKKFTLEVAVAARAQLLQAGFKVEMTRTDDTSRSLEERINFGNQFPNAIFISIHFNSGSGIGIESFALAPDGAPSNVSLGEHHLAAPDTAKNEGNAQDSQNIALAAAVHAAVLSRVTPYDRGIKHARFKVLRDLRIPALLLEAGFLDDAVEGKSIATANYRQKLGTAIAEGVKSYNAAINYRPSNSTLSVARASLPPASNPVAERSNAGEEAGSVTAEALSPSVNAGK
jgi:N-acetylmuramoyl-L-alanine amidase